MLRLWVYEYLNGRLRQVGDVGIMCPATIFKLPGIVKYSEYLIMELYMELLYVFSMELLLAGIYLSDIYLRKLVDYQWNTIYYLYWKDYPGTLMIGRS